ncbi:aldo/keto reductase [Thermocrinis minervae]|uniref:Predicted oxidoreductase n=1 Tax=Thermocrinis minervae TaxID=381751 RepID=A0A1M6RVN1_9AQUI|nr:aldo/keto reductase [Thermocrinis minervae]SHK36513.1 Predicted oxidoreductase [Thermocrinis minervae]
MNLSKLGIGTYLGELDQKTSEGYKEVIREGIRLGINVVDTAIVYRYMKSERDIGQVLQEVGREKVFLSTKGGYVPYDYDLGQDPKDYFYENFVNTGIIKLEEMTPQGHYLGASFIDWCFNKSLENLRTDYIDVYFLHNPEEQLNFFPRETFYRKLRECFELLEHKVKEGRLKYYGLATWSGFRVSPSSRIYLDLSQILSIAREVAGEDHHLRFIQLPYNLGMPEAFTLKNQEVNGKKLSTIEACKELGLYIYTSASIYQGNVIGRVPHKLKEFFGTDDDVLTALAFVINTPGVGTALVGMSKKEHLLHNVKVLGLPRIPEERFLTLFG